MNKNSLTAVIVAGGLGTRLRPLTDKVPKPLLSIKGTPILEHTIRNLKKHGIRNIILSVGYKAELIQNYLKDGSQLGVNIKYSIEDELLGTGGATKKAIGNLSEPFFLIWGDNLSDINLSKMYKDYLRNKTPIVMTLTTREDVENFGVAKLEGSKIISFIEKPKREEAPSNLISAGVFIIESKCLKDLPKGISSLERDCFEKFACLGMISAYIHTGQWFPTDTLEKYNFADLNYDVGIRKKRTSDWIFAFQEEKSSISLEN